MAIQREEMTPHCLVFPLGLQGHVNPMVQFAKRLRSKGITRITFAVADVFTKTLTDFKATFHYPVETIADGFNYTATDELSREEVSRGWKVGSESLARLLERYQSEGSGVNCLIYDAFFPWALDVAKKYGSTAAAFFTQSNSVNCIYLHAYKGELKLPVSEPEIRITGELPVFSPADMPTFIRDYDSDPLRCEIMSRQFMNADAADFIFVNTFYELEHEVCELMAKITPTRPIGPMIPSMHTDRRIPDDKAYSLSAFKPVKDVCKTWLDKNGVGSVIYVSFGSFAEAGVNQMEELALALKTSEMKFLWVVRAAEESKLPQNYREETSDLGLIVTWCNQLEVLAHEAVGCFVSHCGWNSTLEALNSGVPMVAVPQWSDQFTNAKLVADVWRTGIRAEADGKGIIRKEEIVRCVKYVMEGEKGEDIKRSAGKWKKLAREAVDEGGSSDKNIQEFLSALHQWRRR